MRSDAPQAMQEKRTVETLAVREAKVNAVRELIRKESEVATTLLPARSVDNKGKARFILNNPEGMIALIFCVLFVLWIVKA